MKEIQLLHDGKVYHGRIGYDQQDIVEVDMLKPVELNCGDKVLCFDFQRRQPSRVLHISRRKVILAPADSELFQIGTRPALVYEDMFNDDQQTVKSFKLNSFGTLTDDFKITSVHITDISQLGIGIEVNDFSMKLNHVYNSMIICDDECIHPKVILRYAHILEKTIRYGAEIHQISVSDLNKLRYHIVTQQFKQLMHV
jgi:hypothetical protein